MKVLEVMMGISMLLLAGGCAKNIEPPIFKGIDNVQLSQAEKGLVGVRAEAHLYNPNDLKVKLKAVDMRIVVKGKKVGEMKKSYSLTILPKSDFNVPIGLDIDLSELGLVNAIIGILGGNDIEVQYIGVAKVTVKGIPVSVPIDYMDKFNLK